MYKNKIMLIEIMLLKKNISLNMYIVQIGTNVKSNIFFRLKYDINVTTIVYSKIIFKYIVIFLFHYQ